MKGRRKRWPSDVQAVGPSSVGRLDVDAKVAVYPLGDAAAGMSGPRWSMTPDEAERLGHALIDAAEKARVAPPRASSG